ncbi:MAG: hypothetical protein IJT30_11220 [Muribaculaceae bacterium]|nr:hypothetical protein [Muribaculaceae bacterium]
MKKFLISALVALTCFTAAQAQFFGVDTDKLNGLVAGLTRLPYDNAKMIMGQTFRALEDDGRGYRKAVELLDRLGDPTDSLHNEVLYLEGLKMVTSSYVLSNSEKQRPQLLLDLARKNSVGAAATDLSLEDATGKATQLLAGGDTPTLVFFHDMDCEACAQARQAIAANTTLSNLASQGKLRVVAVYTGKNDKAFKKADFPSWVTSTWDKAQQVEQSDAYVLQTSPLFYLINNDGRVLVKNEPSLTRIENALAKIAASSDHSTATLVKLLFNN